MAPRQQEVPWQRHRDNAILRNQNMIRAARETPADRLRNDYNNSRHTRVREIVAQLREISEHSRRVLLMALSGDLNDTEIEQMNRHNYDDDSLPIQIQGQEVRNERQAEDRGMENQQAEPEDGFIGTLPQVIEERRPVSVAMAAFGINFY